MEQYKSPMIDGHVHVYTDKCVEYFLNYKKEYGFKNICVACLCNLNKGMENDGTQNILAAIMKLIDPDIYALGGLVYPEFPVREAPTGDYDFAAQVKELMEIGFDGIKMLENKPTTRKLTGLATDDPMLDSFYKYIEDNDIAVISHVADPETFWDFDLAPEFSHKEGWFYGDGTFLSKEEIYHEVKNTLEKYPKIRFTFPHFFFLSDYIGEARKLLDKHPNLKLDITPGREMYDNFTRHYDEAKEFFNDYSNRIIFGTDMTSDAFQGKPGDMFDAITRFLSTEDEFEYWDFKIKGIGLSHDKVKAICHDNFLSNLAPTPKPVNKAALKAYIGRMLPLVKDKETAAFIKDFADCEL